MRIHELRITAFGPFADTVVIDFAALSESGLFLLTGSTGAGKTSVLDAVCFALYGDVPGDRASAKRLRSDHAVDGEVPRVELDCTLAGRRFRIVRTPAWERPKKRGAGLIRQQPSVVVSELRGADWHCLATRPDEAGHLISELLGMTMAQFTQVAMLPQGRFQAFLRSRSEDRHKLLQRLFRTARFEQIEKWLTEHRIDLVRGSRLHQRTVADLVSRLSEAAATGFPPDWELSDLALPAESGELERWVSALAGATAREARRARTRAAEHRRRALAAATAAEQAHALHRRRDEHSRAAAERERLIGLGPAVEEMRAVVTASQRAASVLPLLDALSEAETLHRQRADAWGRALAELGLPHSPEGGDLLITDLQARRDATAQRASLAAALAPLQARQRTLRRQVSVWETESAALEERAAELVGRLDTLPGRLTELARRRDDAAGALARTSGLEQALHRAESVLTAAHEVALVTEEHAAALDRQRRAIDEALALKEQWLTLQERRVTGMAASLARQLVVGSSCPVCGSEEHPHPASSDAELPDLAAEREARSRVDDAETARIIHDDAVRDLVARLSTATAIAAGTAVEDARTRRDRAASELAQARALADDWSAADEALRAAQARGQELGDELHRVQAMRARTGASLDSAREEIGDIGRTLAHEFGVEADTELQTLADRARAEVGRLESALAATRLLVEARGEVGKSTARARAAAQDAGFLGLEDAGVARLAAEELASVEERLRAHDAALVAVEATLADPELIAARAALPPDLPALDAAFAEADQAVGSALRHAELTRARATRVAELAAELRAAEVAWAPLRADLELATRLSTLAEGKSADNRLQMRLSAYVLAHRLAQVIDAANARLDSMSGRRYRLEHSGRRGAGESRGGLSMLVRDDWSGEARDPATLSGGETFLVSLALALGLADVISDEVGGADLDTLFVDEGFGSLDADTLDDVMDTLDSQRDGGRVVGVVSHVAEMRDRIPTQLAILKSRRGSTVRLVR